MPKFLNGAELALYIKERQIKQSRNLRQSWGVIPKLAILLCGNNPASELYVRLKCAYAEDILVETESIHCTETELPTKIATLNLDKSVHGIIVQLPIDTSGDIDTILHTISPEKDVDGLGSSGLYDSATATAIDWLLAGYNIDSAKKHTAIVGAEGRLVGKPLMNLWRHHKEVRGFEKDDTLADVRNYELIISAVGTHGILDNNNITSGAIVVDAGITHDNGAFLGDAAEELYERSDITITPKKGGLGPMTIAVLLDNVIRAARGAAEKNT